MQPSLMSQYRRLATARQQCGYRYWDVIWESVAFRFAVVFTLSVSVGLAVLLLPFHNLKWGALQPAAEPSTTVEKDWNLPINIHIGEMRRGLSSPVTLDVRQHEPAPKLVREPADISNTQSIQAWPDGWTHVAAKVGARFSCWGAGTQIWSLDLARPYAHLHCPALI